MAKLFNIPKYILWPLRLLAGVIVLAALLLGSGIAWLSTDSGRAYTENLITHELSESIGYTIAVSDVTFAFPLTASLSKFVLSDTQGAWLEADNISIRLLPTPFIREHLIIQNLRADSLRLLRAPEPAASSPDNGGNMNVSVLRTEIRNLSLDPSVTGLEQPLEGNADSALGWDGENERLTFNATSHITQGLPEFGQGDIKLSGNYDLKNNTVTLDSWEFIHPRLALTGNGIIRLDTETIEGSAKAEAIDLAQWVSSLHGLAALDGRVSGSLDHPVFTASISARNVQYGAQELPALAAQITGVSKDNGWEGKLSIEGEKSIKGETLYVWSGNEVILKEIQVSYGDNTAAGNLTVNADSLKLRVSEGVYSDVQVHKATLSARRNDNGWQGELAAEGVASEPFTIAAAGTVAEAEGEWRVDLTSLKGRYAALPISAKSPVHATFSGNAWSLKAPRIMIGDGMCSLDASLAENTINASFKGEHIRLSTIKPDIPGEFQSSQATVSLSLKGDVSKPNGRADIQVSPIQLYPSAPPANIKAQATLNDGRLHIDGKLTDGKSVVSDIAGSMPMQFSVMPFALQIKDNAPLEGKTNLALDVAVFSKWLLPAGHVLKGEARGALTLAGTYAEPSLSGNITLADGAYDYLDLGVKLRKITASIAAQNSSFILRDFHAEDMGGNRLTGKGTLDIASKESMVYQAEFDGNNLALFHHPNLQGALSGHIELTGDSGSGQVKGKVQSKGINIYLPDRFVGNVPELNVVRTIPPRKGDMAQTDSSTAYAMRLDMLLEADNQVFIRGWGVDAELQGALTLTGTAANPEIEGKLSTIRGRYEEFGRQFRITQGELVFEGDIPPSPFLNVVARAQAGNVEIRPMLSGPLLAPSLKIESTPAMPQDEALSVLLFGKDSRRISPFQAVQLANSLRKLSGHGGQGFDPIGKVRRLMGVDDISVNSGGENGTDTSVGVGKHIGENVYLGVERGADAASGKARIEVEVTPSISVESSTGATGDSSVGINWKRDY